MCSSFQMPRSLGNPALRQHRRGLGEHQSRASHAPGCPGEPGASRSRTRPPRVLAHRRNGNAVRQSDVAKRNRRKQMAHTPLDSETPPTIPQSSHELTDEMAIRCAAPARRGTGRIPQDFARFAGFLAELFSATASRTSALNAASSTSSPSWMSIARRTLPSRLELNSPAGSGSDAPLAKVSFTTFL